MATKLRVGGVPEHFNAVSSRPCGPRTDIFACSPASPGGPRVLKPLSLPCPVLHPGQPWYIAKQKGAFAAAGIELEYTDYPGGTGAMTKALNENALDVAILLTEGCVKDIATGGAHKIVAVNSVFLFRNSLFLFLCCQGASSTPLVCC
jgi:hypothetical protein